MKVVSLRSAETVSGKKHFVVVSTCDMKTEEVSSKGKVGGRDTPAIVLCCSACHCWYHTHACQANAESRHVNVLCASQCQHL